MNPFAWSGPWFLLFYLVLAALLLVAQAMLRRAQEAETQSAGNPPKFNDPYLVAYLSGEKIGLIRCAIISLLEQKALRVQDEKLDKLVADPNAVRSLQNPIETAVAGFFASPNRASGAFRGLKDDPQVKDRGRYYQSQLSQAGLLINPDQKDQILYHCMIVCSVLIVTAAIKLIIALSTGHKNVLFLILLTIFAVIGSFAMTRIRLTKRGEQTQQDLKHLFGDLKNQDGHSMTPAEVALIASVFGVAALGGTRAMYAKTLFPAAQSSSSGCGSSCGSGDGGDGGGGDGGGGGCGGCGGGDGG